MFERPMFSTKVDYMTPAEKEVFKRLRDSGTISYFREVPCRKCGAPIIKGKLYCSRKCKEEVMDEWRWEIDLDNLIGVRFLIETTDSMYREGTLTRIDYDEFALDGVSVRRPTVFELDNDPGNQFDVDRIKSMERVVE